ncbi:MAG: hypothetical protein JJU06_21060 [Ectothiorhodospiraceae bacterium]|nr:hypothetical protein [Ectothiorhodospiraceae bacterium]
MITIPAHLRSLLMLDAATCLVMGIVLVAGAAVIANLTAIPSVLLFYAGLILFPSAALMAFTATRAISSSLAVWLIIGGNGLWALASLALMFGNWITPNLLGHLLIGSQALIVAVLTGLEHAAWRQGGTPVPT